VPGYIQQLLIFFSKTFFKNFFNQSKIISNTLSLTEVAIFRYLTRLTAARLLWYMSYHVISHVIYHVIGHVMRCIILGRWIHHSHKESSTQCDKQHPLSCFLFYLKI